MIYQLCFGIGHATPVVNGSFATREAAETALADRQANGTAFPNERVVEFAEYQGHRTSKAEPKNIDTPASHLRNALQILTLLAAEIPKMIGNPGYQDDATKALASIDERIRAALAGMVGAQEGGIKRRVGKTQASVYESLVRHRRWFHGCGWLWDTDSHTRQLMDSLVRRGLATVDAKGVYKPTGASILDGRVILLSEEKPL